MNEYHYNNYRAAAYRANRNPVAETRRAAIIGLHDNLRVVTGSEEVIFEDTFVTAITANGHTVKVKKNALKFKND